MVTEKYNDIHVAFATDANFVQHLCCAMASILKNASSNDYLHFHILTDGLSEKAMENIKTVQKLGNGDVEFININSELFKDVVIPPNTQWTIATWFRLILAEVLPKLERVIYLDGDISVLTSLWDLYNTDLGENFYAAVEDISIKKHTKRLGLDRYYNAGVLLINLEKWRSDKIADKLLEYAVNNTDKIVYLDQDVLNVVLQGKIKTIDDKWNCQVLEPGGMPSQRFNRIAEKGIIHFIGVRKPWGKSLCPFRFIYLKYLMMTPYRAEVLKIIPKYIQAFVSFICKGVLKIRISKGRSYLVLLGMTLYDSCKNKEELE